MKTFNKPAKTFAEQIELLKARGMQFANEQAAQFYLEQINYYRLGAYWLPFEYSHSPHCFKPDTSFEQHAWRKRLIDLLITQDNIYKTWMGFPQDWQTYPIWQISQH